MNHSGMVSGTDDPATDEAAVSELESNRQLQGVLDQVISLLTNGLDSREHHADEILQFFSSQEDQSSCQKPHCAENSKYQDEILHQKRGDSVQCKPCFFFQKGLCMKGSRCGFCHELNHAGVAGKRLRPSKRTRELLKLINDKQ
jgi:hypothetical protein